MKVLTLKIATDCSGIGSPEVALKELGIPHEIVFACDKDKYARQTYLANHSPGRMFEDMTIRDNSDPELYADIYAAGIPCQSFSLAGKRLGELDPRGLLFYNFYDYVKQRQPKVFIIENVMGLLSDNKGRTFQNWLDLLSSTVNRQHNFIGHPDSLGYNVHWTVLNAKDFGIPQNRERVFIVGIRKDLPNTFRFPAGERLTTRLRDFLDKEVDERYFLSEKALKSLAKEVDMSEGSSDVQVAFISRSDEAKRIRRESLAKGKDYSPFQEKKIKFRDQDYINTITCAVSKDCLIKVKQMNPSKESQGRQTYQQNRVYSEDGLSPALLAERSDIIVQQAESRIRRLTPREALRLMGYGDDFIMPVSETQQYRQAGNSIVTKVIKAVIKNTLPCLE